MNESGGPATPILELDTSSGPEARHVEIDGRAYRMLHPEEMSLRGRLEFARRSSKLGLIGTLDMKGYAELDIRLMADLERALDQCVRDVLPDIEPDVVARLNPDNKLAIIAAFGKGQNTDDGDSDPEAEGREDVPAEPQEVQESRKRTAPYRLSKRSMEGRGRAG